MANCFKSRRTAGRIYFLVGADLTTRRPECRVRMVLTDCPKLQLLKGQHARHLCHRGRSPGPTLVLRCFPCSRAFVPPPHPPRTHRRTHARTPAGRTVAGRAGVESEVSRRAASSRDLSPGAQASFLLPLFVHQSLARRWEGNSRDFPDVIPQK